MPNDLVRTHITAQELRNLHWPDAVDSYEPEFKAALPDHVPLDRFKRTIITALNLDPELTKCDKLSFFLAAVKCATDGLYPDGREAALVAIGGKVQYFPMIAGIRKMMRNSGEVMSATAEVVYRNDTFHYELGDNPSIEHKPPPLDQERGEPLGAYARIILTSGEILREVMGLKEIERIRAFSRTKREDSPWNKHWGEMARKTVLRRCSKSAPISSDLSSRIEQMLSRAEEQPEPMAPEDIPPRPRRDDPVYTGNGEIETDAQSDPPNDGNADGAAALVTAPTDEQAELWSVTDPVDGTVTECPSVEQAESQLSKFFKAALDRALAAKPGSPAAKSLEEAVEINDALLKALPAAVYGRMQGRISTALEQVAKTHAKTPPPSAEAAKVPAQGLPI